MQRTLGSSRTWYDLVALGQEKRLVAHQSEDEAIGKAIEIMTSGSFMDGAVVQDGARPIPAAMQDQISSLGATLR